MNNKVAIVTGAGTGIGYAIVRELLGRGVRVLLNDLDKEMAADCVRRLEAGDRCIALAGDAGEVGFVRTMVEEAVRVFGRLDIAVANAGSSSRFGSGRMLVCSANAAPPVFRSA